MENPKMLSWLIVQYDGRCVYCLQRTVRSGVPVRGGFKATRDHDIPGSRGGGDGEENSVLACEMCNQAKADMTGKEYLYFLKTGVLAKTYINWLTMRARVKSRVLVPAMATA